MKTQNFESDKNTFDGFILSTEEMTAVRGGEGDPIAYPTKPPIKI
jgi:hypothetical protein